MSRLPPTFAQEKIVSRETIYNEINNKLNDTFKQLAQGPDHNKFTKRLLQLALVANDYFQNLNHDEFGGLNHSNIIKAKENRRDGEKAEHGIKFNKDALKSTFESGDFEEVKSAILRDPPNKNKVKTLAHQAENNNNIFARALLARVVKILAWGDKKLNNSGFS